MIEVLAAMVIFTVGLLGLLQSVNVAIGQNVRDEYRNTAVLVGEQVMNELRAKPFQAISSIYAPQQKTVKVRGLDKNFVYERYTMIQAYNSDLVPQPVSKELQVVVKWTYRNVTSQHLMKSVMSIPDN